ncbi:MAG: sensor signal transduction histidine kinase [Paenibacillus sp.]|uniref:PAS domain S-box protein n=1 Tax=Paenibacillus sp. GCM10012303 TaxID=3317340 RepID=UPI0029F383EE|nr:sensor signal transduction histidine kinase [Paenibacillus sp.]
MTKDRFHLQGEGWFAQAFAHAPVGMALVSADGRWLTVNETVCSVIGYAEDELMEMTVRSIVHPDEMDVLLASLTGLLDGTQNSLHLEIRALHKTGCTVRVQLCTSLVRDESEQPCFFVLVLQDVSCRKTGSPFERLPAMSGDRPEYDSRLQSQLEHSNRMYRLFSENSQDVITITSNDGTILFISPASRSVMGYEPEELIGRLATELWHPEDRAVFESSAPDLISGGSSFECRVRHKNGCYFWFESTVKPLDDADGGSEHILGVGRNITDRKRAEKKLRAAKERMESFIRNNVDPIMIMDSESIVLQVNEAFENRFGWSGDEIVGRPLGELGLIPPDRSEEIQRNIQRLTSGESLKGFETVRQCKDGTKLNVLVTAFPMNDERGRLSGWSVSLRDMSDRKHAEELMINSEKLSLAGQLAAGIAHEIRNPITAIKGFVQLMRNGYAEKKEYFDIIASEITRIEMILNELLILAKPQTVKLERQDIRVLLAQVTTLLDTQAILNNVQIVTEFSPGITHISCDENQLKQVFINFIKNAIEAMPGGGEIVIRLKREGTDRIRLSIIDQGCGIPEHVLGRIGQPFYTTKENGTGLGFMVSKRIIENHHGTVKVTSCESSGTTVDVVLPLAHEQQTGI